MKKSNHFLTGGYDLEMLEIKKLLKELKIPFSDKKLRWDNASWKAYKDEIEKNQKDDITFVGIELKDKDHRPIQSIDIDHHNENRCKKSSLEQVAGLLNIELDNYQKLVAANDKGYIRAMLDMGASANDIEAIRSKEREILGITEDDWQKAKESVNEYLTKEGNLWIIEAQTPRFTAISDYLWMEKLKVHWKEKTAEEIPEKIIIFNNTSINYSGQLYPALTEKYEKLIEEGKVYYGGQGERAYLGFTEEAVKQEGKDKLLKELKELVTGKPVDKTKMFSYHIFLFPFRWKNITKKGNQDSLDNKYSLKLFDEKLKKDDKRWEKRPYKLNNGTTYNEYNYFFDFVREILYYQGEELITDDSLPNKNIISHYEFNNGDKPQILYYNILVDNKLYSLEIDSIILNIYSTGVGVLSFHLRNRLHKNENDILIINKFGRRLFPPFLGLPDENVNTGSTKDIPLEYLCQVKGNELPEAVFISEKENGKDVLYYEDWQSYTNPDYFKYGPFHLPGFITGLFPDNFFTVHEKENKNKDKKVYLRPALDDRMFVISWYANDKIINEISKLSYCKNPPAYNYTDNEFWHNYIFIDTSRTFQNNLQLPGYLEKHTYSRWVEWGTLYGMSRYSMVMLTGEQAPKFLIRHLQTIYYKMTELALLQRASVISFSDEITHVADLVHSHDDNAVKRIDKLYRHYLLFVNKIYFREITPQEQGIEMYDMMKEIMRIPEQVKELDKEIDELNKMAVAIHNDKEQREMKTHTWLATFFLPAMLISAILGMSMWQTGNLKIPKYFFSTLPVATFWVPTVIITLIICVFIWRNKIVNFFNRLKFRK